MRKSRKKKVLKEIKKKKEKRKEKTRKKQRLSGRFHRKQKEQKCRGQYTNTVLFLTFANDNIGCDCVKHENSVH